MINIVLYQPEIPQNCGNIMRTCAGTNTKLHLIKPLGFKLDEKSIKRSGANYLEHCEYTLYENWDEFKSKNKGAYYYLTRYGQKSHSSFVYTKEENIYLIFGKESTGIPKEILKDDIEHCMRIPMNANIRSLNLSNCVAIMLYEVLRQHQYPELLMYEPFKSKDFLSE